MGVIQRSHGDHRVAECRVSRQRARPFWKVRLIAILLTIGLAGFIILSITLILYGEHIGSWIANVVGLGSLFEVAWIIFQWPVAIALMLFALAAMYYFLSQCPAGLAVGDARIIGGRPVMAGCLAVF